MVRRNMIAALQKAIWPLVIAVGMSAFAQATEITLYDGKRVATIVHMGADNLPIANAAALLARDLAELTGRRPTVTVRGASDLGTGVIIGVVQDPPIASLLSANGIDWSPIAGKWETYGRAAIKAPWNAKEKALLIFGSDVRGAIWGVVDLSRELGVSPWEWWADVKIRAVKKLRADGALRYSREPSVKYRAIFLNDEDYGLWPWAAKTYDPELGDIGPKTYQRIYELMWRLKANTIWPAMHNISSPFNRIAGNPEMARAYAIIHATSHAEPMLRSNVREWDEKARGEFNYITNRPALLKYWDERAIESRDFENIYTVGLRGIHDSPLVGADTARARSLVLADVIAEQRKILESRLGKPASAIPQAFTAYKEVLQAYDAGLALPDDIMLTWPDDNHGYIRRLPNAKERSRSGGSGVYYHISYWGSPMSYLWLATTHPALLWEEMDKAYRFDARKIWVLNVGDIKPGEYLTELFLDIAWNAAAFPNPDSVRAHLARWTRATFGRKNAAPAADILWRYYDLAFARRPEFMGFNDQYPTTAVRQTSFNIESFGDENARRQAAYEALVADVRRLKAVLPADRRDAFYQLVEYPVVASAAMSARQLGLDKAIAYGLQRRASANVFAARVAQAQETLEASARAYNEQTASGKWRGMMDIAPYKLPQYAPPAVPTWGATGEVGCGLQLEGGEYYDGGGNAPENVFFRRELPRPRYIDVFAKSDAALVKWTAVSDAPWLKLSQSAGTLSKNGGLERRLWAAIDPRKAPAPAEAHVTITCEGTAKPLVVRLRVLPPLETKGVSFVEVDRIVSIYAVHADVRGAGWDVMNGLGHTGASLRSALDTRSIDAGSAAEMAAAPSLTYRFATATAADLAALSIYALPTLPVTSENGLRAAVSIDGAPPVVLDFATEEFSQQWRQNVFRNAAVARVGNLKLMPGAHELKITALDPGLVLDRFEIAFAGAKQAYLPVPETRIAR